MQQQANAAQNLINEMVLGSAKQRSIQEKKLDEEVAVIYSVFDSFYKAAMKLQNVLEKENFGKYDIDKVILGKLEDITTHDPDWAEFADDIDDAIRDLDK